MDTSKLKPFAQDARRILKAQVSARLDQVLAEQSAARREQPKAVSELEAEIAKSDRDQVIEKVAYTWFNRFTALRFMDANGYTRLKVVSPAEGQTRPEILAEAAAGNIDEDAPADVRNKVAALLDGRTPSRDPQGEAYRLLLVAACNQWHSAMPFMFEKIADYTELLMPEDLLSADSILAKARTVMTAEACQDVEVIGWLYQFYISEKKDEVFAGLKKSKKITAENIPAATQLFTPHWIVRYLVENSLGRLWLLNRPNSRLAAQMDYYIAPQEPEADFLRVSRPEDIKICDPACGSGHMLTYAFDLLYAIYEEEGYEATEIPGLILTNNLHGIEIDDRAGALAAFALAMKAADKLGRRRFMRQAVQPNICVLQDVRFTASEMQDVAALVGSDLYNAEFRETIGQFDQAKNYGSLIVPKLRDPFEVARLVRLKGGGDLLHRELRARIIKILEMSDALSCKYQVVLANPPYIGYRNMNGQLGEFLKSKYEDFKYDVFSCFIARCFYLTKKLGIIGIMSPNTWMYLSSYEKTRNFISSNIALGSLVELPLSGFAGATVQICAFVADKKNPSGAADFIRLTEFKGGEDEMSRRTQAAVKSHSCEWRYAAKQSDFDAIPGRPFAYWLNDSIKSAFSKFPHLREMAVPRQGNTTTDNGKYVRLWFEVEYNLIGFNAESADPYKNHSKFWAPYNKGGGSRRFYGLNESVVFWKNNGSDIKSIPHSVVANEKSYFKPGITWSTISSTKIGFRYFGNGFIFDNKGACIFIEGDEQLYLLGLLNSRVFTEILYQITPTVSLQPGDVAKFPVIPMAKVNAPDVLGMTRRCLEIEEEDWDSFETSWNFSTLPILSTSFRGENIAETYDLLRAYWRGRSEEMQQLEENNNRTFIDAYGLQNELVPDVPSDEVTLNCNPAYRYGGKSSEADRETRLLQDTAAEFLHYAVGCMFGRYSLDVPGLILANQGEGLADYLARVPQPTFEPDADNVIPVLDGDWFADGIAERFRKFLRVSFGEAKFQENLAFIEGALGKDIRKWFTRDFYDYHVRRYKKRPIYWMFSSPKGSFQALIYMHRYRPDTVSVLLNDYLREYRNKLEAHRKSLESLSSSANASPAQRTKAEKEISEVTKVIAELDAYERDVLFPLATQKIEIDLDEGVKANYPKFGDALKPIKGLSDADD